MTETALKDEIAKLKGLICGLEVILQDCYQFKSVPPNFYPVLSLSSAPKHEDDKDYSIDILLRYLPYEL